MQLFYAPELVPPDYILPEEESRHCVRVLRMTAGDALWLTDGCGRLFRCEIVQADVRRCAVRVVETVEGWGKLPYRLELAVAPTKSADRYEWFLEKATEVGVTTFVPVETARSERHLFKSARAEKVITAAMKQSLKGYRPELRDLMPFRELVAEPFAGRRLIAHCDAARTPAGKRFLARCVQPGDAVRLLVGPEGDFSPEEIDWAVAHGYEEITLGSQRLRTETAAVVAAVLVASVNETD